MSLLPARETRYDRLLTPSTHLGLLIEPGAERLRAFAAEQSRSITALRLLDTTVGALRAELRASIGGGGPLVVTGHQAEFFHAGVLAKTIAAVVLARRVGGRALFVTVDSDQPKTTRLAVPQSTASGVRQVTVALPGCDPRLAFEDQPPAAREQWLPAFGQAAATYPLYGESVLGTFARAWLSTPGAAPPYCDALAQARAATEADLGLGVVPERRISALSATRAFRVLTAHLLRHADQTRVAYNRAVEQFRTRHHVRARGRPVPPLATDARGIETPLWIMRAGQPRHRLFIEHAGARCTLWAGDTPAVTLTIGDLDGVGGRFVCDPAALEGWSLRPRALLLSAFLRLLLADLFLHGIGGAKYDEVTEDWFAAQFGVALPALGCVSATLRLPLPHSRFGPPDLSAARRNSRDLRWNPQRHVHGLPAELAREREALVQRSDELRAQQPRDRAARRLVFQALRRANEELLAHDPWRAAAYDERVAALERQLAQDRVALDREYFYALHPRAALLELVAALDAAL